MVFLLLACAHAPAEPAPTPAEPPSAPTTPAAPVILGEADAAGNATTLTLTPSDRADLYASCKARVEGADLAGECKTSADCKPAGCSNEVCVTVADAATTNTMCDVQPCFAVLDQCGCVDGRCSWSLKSSP